MSSIDAESQEAHGRPRGRQARRVRGPPAIPREQLVEIALRAAHLEARIAATDARGEAPLRPRVVVPVVVRDGGSPGPELVNRVQRDGLLRDAEDEHDEDELDEDVERDERREESARDDADALPVADEEHLRGFSLTRPPDTKTLRSTQSQTVSLSPPGSPSPSGSSSAPPSGFSHAVGASPPRADASRSSSPQRWSSAATRVGRLRRRHRHVRGLQLSPERVLRHLRARRPPGARPRDLLAALAARRRPPDRPPLPRFARGPPPAPRPPTPCRCAGRLAAPRAAA